MNNTDKGVVMMSYTPAQISSDIAKNLEPTVREIVNQLISEKAEDDERLLTMKESAEWLRIGSTLFSKLVNRGEIDFISDDPDNPRAKKLFQKKDLKAWVEKNRQQAINSIRDSFNNGK